MTRHSNTVSAHIFLSFVFLMAFGARLAHPNVVLDWNAVMMAAVRIDNSGPTLSSRNLAILHVAIYDAVNSVVRSHQPYLVQLESPPGTSAEAAASAAGFEVLRVLYPGILPRAENTLESWRASAPSNQATTNGLNLGLEVARQILSARNSDGSATDVPYIPDDAPGQWRRTPPFYRPPLTPQWRYVQPFGLTEIESFVPGPPPALNSPEYANDLNTVKALGGKVTTIRTPEQSQIAVFWSDFSYTSMPPGHWHEIATAIARNRSTDLAESARLMALLSIAQADGAIVCWEAKFRYNLWRPVTAIQQADMDDNPATIADPAWDHLLASPPFPAYTSGHSTFSKASAEVLTLFYGTDAIAFTAASDSLPGVFRTFNSLAACADEVGMSRIYGGIHFPSDNVEGKLCGKRIANYVVANLLLPTRDLPLVRIERFENAEARVRVHGNAGSHIVLESSTDLRTWQPASTNLATRGGSLVSVPRGNNAHGFFRAHESITAR